MADEVDIAALTEQQQLALQQYTAVTDQELPAAVRLLQRCEWNVQIAIARHFDGEQPVVDDTPSIPPPQTSRRTDTLAAAILDPPRQSVDGPRFEPAPRVVAPSESQLSRPAPFLLSVVFAPANLVIGIIWRVFSAFSYMFPFLPRLLSRLRGRVTGLASHQHTGRRPLGPQDTTVRFLREFEEEYGTHSLPLLETGYSRAFDLAKRDLKFLVAIPVAPEHDGTDSFVRDILLSELTSTFFNQHSDELLLWAGSVQDSEAYQVSTTLNITKFPTAAVIVHTPSVSSTAMSVVARIAAPESAEDFVARIEAAMAQHSGALVRARSTRAEQDANRSIREQQNSAYERSLAADRERARQRREEEAQRAQEERERQEAADRARQLAQDVAAWKQWRAARVAPEPPAADKEAVRVSLRLASGERTTRRFAAGDAIEEVYAVAECWAELQARAGGEPAAEASAPAHYTHKYGFRLVSPLPRAEIPLAGTIGEQLGRSGNLIVERIDEEDGDED